MQHARSDYRRIQDLTTVFRMITDSMDKHYEEGEHDKYGALLEFRNKLEAAFGPFNLADEIPMDEPVFLLRAKDKVAWIAVQKWAGAAAAERADADMVLAAEKWSQYMQVWPGQQVPDMPPQGPCVHCNVVTHLKSGDVFCCSPECAGG